MTVLHHEEEEGVFPKVIANQLWWIHQNISPRQGRHVSLENSSLVDLPLMEVQPLQLSDNSAEVNIENVGSSNTNLSDQWPEILSSLERQRQNKRSRQCHFSLSCHLCREVSFNNAKTAISDQAVQSFVLNLSNLQNCWFNPWCRLGSIYLCDKNSSLWFEPPFL